MYQGEKILALIPARGGSKGIKDKNIIMVCDKPLLAYTIQAAKGSCYVDSVVVTTDSEKISNIAQKYGAEVPFMRPAELAKDQSKTIDAVLHAIQSLKQMGRHYGVLVLLQPTQPLRTIEDIDEAIKCFFEQGEQPLASVSLVNDHPLLIRSIEGGRLKSILHENSTCRRQDMKPYYRINGGIYINRIDELTVETSFNDNRLPFIMARDHSVDVDEAADLMMVEYYLRLVQVSARYGSLLGGEKFESLIKE